MQLSSFFNDRSKKINMNHINFNNNNSHINVEFRHTVFVSLNNKKIQYFELKMSKIFGNVENYAILSPNLIEMISKELEVVPLYRIINSGLVLPNNCLEVSIISLKHSLLIHNLNYFLKYNLVLDEYEYFPFHPILAYSFSEIHKFYKQQFSHQIFFQQEKKVFFQVIRNYLSTYIYEFSA